MASPVDTTLRLVDRISKPLRNIANQTEHVINRMERLQRVVKANGGQLPKEQEKITKAVEKTAKATSNWNTKLFALVGTYLTLSGAAAGLGIADEFTKTTSRLDNVNDQLQTTAELQELIYQASQRTGGSYLALQQSVAKLGQTASQAFGSTQEIVAFSELLQKSFAVGGASTSEQQAGLLQLTQALASGRLQGDEFVSITENAPLIAQAIEKYLGIARAELRELSSEGKITSDIIRDAIFASAVDIEDRFSNIPLTFDSAFQQIKNYALNSLAPVIAYLNGVLNSEQGLQTINNIKLAIGQLQPVLIGVIDAVATFGSVFNSIFPYLPAIITTAVTALTAYYLISRQQLIIDTAAQVKKAVLTAVTIAQTIATVGLTQAWYALNAAMKANVIILIVSLVIALVAWIINLAKTNDDFAVGFLRVWHGILNFFDQIPVFFYTLIDAMIEPFKLWAKTIGKLYDAVINGIISGINKVLSLVNSLTGSSYEISTKFNFEELVNGLDSFVGDKKASAEAKALAKKLDRENSLSEFKAGREAKRLAESVAEPDQAQYGGVGNYSAFTGSGTLGDIGKVGEVGKINDSVDISSEDLKAMRELAEMNSIQNFVTLSPTVSFGDTNIRQDGRTTQDILQELAGVIDEQFNASARKVFA